MPRVQSTPSGGTPLQNYGNWQTHSGIFFGEYQGSPVRTYDGDGGLRAQRVCLVKEEDEEQFLLDMLGNVETEEDANGDSLTVRTLPTAYPNLWPPPETDAS